MVKGMARMLFLSLILISHFSLAANSVLTTDFVMSLDQQALAAPEYQLKDFLKGTYSWQLADQVLQAEGVPVQLKGLRLDLDYELLTGSQYPLLDADYFVSSRRLGAKLTVEQIKVDAVIERNVGGVIVRIQVQAQCDKLQLRADPTKTKLNAMVRTTIRDDGHLGLSVPWFDVGWDQGAWTLDPMNCTGATGFDSLLQEEIVRHLKSPDLIKKEIQKRLQSTLDEVTADIESDLFKPRSLQTGIEGIGLVLRPKRLLKGSAGFFAVAGEIDVELSPGQKLPTEFVRMTQVPSIQKANKLYLPGHFLSALQKRVLDAQILQGRVRARDISAWEKIRDNEFWVWPELSRWGDDDEFFLDLLPLNRLRLTDWTNSGTGIQTSVDTNYQIDVLAPFASLQYRRIAYFQAILKSDVLVAIQNSQIQVSFRSPQLQLQALWDTGYTPRTPDIYADLMRDEAVDSLRKEGFAVDLPLLPLNSQLQLKAEGLMFKDSFIELGWK